MRQLKVLKGFYGKIITCLFLGLFSMSCEKEEISTSNLEVADASIKSFNTVKITSTGMNFDAPDEIPSGWTTFTYMNKSDAPHFFILVKIPDNITLEEYTLQVTNPFNSWLDTWRAGAPAEDHGISFWFFTEAFNTGGSGLIDAGESTVTSVNLEPGNYIIECYVKMPNGDFHSVAGMVDQMTVTEEVSKNKEPKADVSISIDELGLHLENEIRRPGQHTFSVDFAAGSDADVHLVKIEDPDAANREELKKWMHWANIIGFEKEGFTTPAPDGFSFLGGTQELKKGGRTYFQAVLRPGTYALVSEVSYYDSNGEILIDNYYEEFTIK